MPIKKGDFVEVEYTGKIKDENIIFDTNRESVAKDNNLYNEKVTYKPVVVVVGEHHLLKGIDDNLEGKDTGEYTFEIAPENGFGKKDPKLLRLVPAKVFKQQQIQPFVGLELDMDGIRGTVRSVSGGRIIVDFNHPLSSKDLVYEVNVKKVLADPKEKIEGLADLLNIKVTNVVVQENTATITYDKTVTESLKKLLTDQVKKLLDLDVKEAALQPKESAEKKTPEEKHSA